jgi:hypothetical protein
MADYQAIEATCETIIHLLRSNFRAEDFNNTDLQFAVYLYDDFAHPMDTGVSLFLYRIFINGSHRIPSGRVGPFGQRFSTKLPLDFHFILTVWAKRSSMQHRIAGWLMRVMEDTPILPHGLLNAKAEGVFQPDETVEISPAEFRTEDMFRLWEILAPNKYYLSIPYQARNVQIESSQRLSEGDPIQTRMFDYRKLTG